MPRIHSTSRSGAVSGGPSPPRSPRIAPSQRPRAETGEQTTVRACRRSTYSAGSLLFEVLGGFEHAVLFERLTGERCGFQREEVAAEQLEVDAEGAGGEDPPPRRVVAEDDDAAERRAARDPLAQAAVEVVGEPLVLALREHLGEDLDRVGVRGGELDGGGDAGSGIAVGGFSRIRCAGERRVR